MSDPNSPDSERSARTHSDVGTGSPRVGIVVLNYENAEDTIRCIESLRSLDYPVLDLILVDNGSSAECAAELEGRYAGAADVEFIQTGRNLGYAAGNNVGIRAALDAGAEYVLILNSDTITEPGFLTPLVDALEADRSVALAMPRFLTEAGADITPIRARPTYWSYYSRFGVIAQLRRRRTRRRGSAPTAPTVQRSDRVIDVEVPCGACMLLRRSFLEDIGLLDEGTFLYQEEFILAEQARERGLRFVFVPDSSVVHHVGRSTSKFRLRRTLAMWGSQNYYLRKYRGTSLPARAGLIAYQAVSFGALSLASALAGAARGAKAGRGK